MWFIRIGSRKSKREGCGEDEDGDGTHCGGGLDCWKVLGMCELGFGGRFVGLSVFVRLGTTARLAAVVCGG